MNAEPGLPPASSLGPTLSELCLPSRLGRRRRSPGQGDPRPECNLGSGAGPARLTAPRRPSPAARLTARAQLGGRHVLREHRPEAPQPRHDPPVQRPVLAPAADAPAEVQRPAARLARLARLPAFPRSGHCSRHPAAAAAAPLPAPGGARSRPRDPAGPGLRPGSPEAAPASWGRAGSPALASGR